MSTPSLSPFAIDHLKIVPRRFYGRWLSAALILLVFAFIINAFVHGQIEWKIVAQFMTAKVIMHGLLNTILMTIYAMTIGILLGVIFAVMVMSRHAAAVADAAVVQPGARVSDDGHSRRV